MIFSKSLFESDIRNAYHDESFSKSRLLVIQVSFDYSKIDLSTCGLDTLILVLDDDSGAYFCRFSQATEKAT